MALDDVAAEAVLGAQRELEVDRRARPSSPSEERSSVSSIASAVKRPSPISVAVRQTPLTAIESPSRRSPARRVLTVSVAPSSPRSSARHLTEIA